ncbi:hypothetical protein I317_05454 [Kwoniella heveanensis CBS 569]|nr:hypothetical protein I317_05454 [Kwoniella heveanensis CBS 569]
MPARRYSEADKALVVRRRMLWPETNQMTTAWANQQGGALSQITLGTISGFVIDYKKKHPAKRATEYWAGIDDRMGGTVHVWESPSSESRGYQGFTLGSIQVSPEDYLLAERRRRIILGDAFRRMMACGNEETKISIQVDVILVVHGLNLLWPVKLVPGGTEFTVDEYLYVVNNYPDLRPLVPTLTPDGTQIYKWGTKEVLQARVIEQRAKVRVCPSAERADLLIRDCHIQRCEELARMADTDLPRHLILYILPRFGTSKVHFAFDDDRTVINPFFRLAENNSEKLPPTTREIDDLVDSYLGQHGYGFSLPALAHAFRAASQGSKGVRMVLDYLVDRRWPAQKHAGRVTDRWLKDEASRYAKLSAADLETLKAEAETIQAEIRASVSGKSDEEVHAWKISKARECLEIWARLENVPYAAFVDYKYLCIQQSARHAQFNHVNHPHLYGFLSAFAVRIGSIPSTKIYRTTSDANIYRWISEWCLFICDDSLDSSIARNGTTGVDLTTRASLRSIASQAIESLCHEEDSIFDRLGIPVPTSYHDLRYNLTNSNVSNRLYWLYANLIKNRPHVLCQYGMFINAITKYMESVEAQPLRQESGWRLCELLLVERYWMEEGSFYGAAQILSPILQRSRTSIREMLRAHGHRFRTEYRIVRDWTKAYGEE